MEIFRVKTSAYDLRDIKNAFRLIAADEDRYIPIERIVTLFKKKDMEQ